MDVGTKPHDVTNLTDGKDTKFSLTKKEQKFRHNRVFHLVLGLHIRKWLVISPISTLSSWFSVCEWTRTTVWLVWRPQFKWLYYHSLIPVHPVTDGCGLRNPAIKSLYHFVFIPYMTFSFLITMSFSSIQSTAENPQGIQFKEIKPLTEENVQQLSKHPTWNTMLWWVCSPVLEALKCINWLVRWSWITGAY